MQPHIYLDLYPKDRMNTCCKLLGLVFSLELILSELFHAATVKPQVSSFIVAPNRSQGETMSIAWHKSVPACLAK